MSIKVGFLPRIEWEGLQQEWEIKENVNANFLKGTSNNIIKIFRDDNYKISGMISGLLRMNKRKYIG